MALLKLNGLFRPYTIKQGSLVITWDDKGGGNASLTMLLSDGGEPPQDGHDASIYLDDGVTKVWGGMITRPVRRQEGRGADALIAFDVTIASYRRLGRRRPAVERYVSRYAGDIVKDVCRRYAPMLDTSLIPVDFGPVIAEWVCSYEYPDDTLTKLADSIGYLYDVDHERQVIFRPLTSNRAPFNLTESSFNFEGLTVTFDRSQLRNVVIVRGGHYPGVQVTETFITDGQRANFPLTREPFGAFKSILLTETFGNPDLSSLWSMSDAPSKFLEVYGDSLQTSGGPGVWGQVGLVSRSTFERKRDRRFEMEFKAFSPAQFAIGWHNGIGVALSSLLHGLVFKQGGTITAVDAGAETPLTTPRAWIVGVDYRVRFILDESGCRAFMQGDTIGSWGSSDWVLVHTWESGTAAYMMAAPLLHHSGAVMVDNVVLRDPPVGVEAEVNGHRLVVGLENVDEANGVDCVLSAKDRLLRFFVDNRPASGTLTVKYRPAVPVITRVSDPASIAAVAALEGGDGVYEYPMPPDPSLESLDAARAAGKADLKEHSSPQITVTYRTLEDGLRPLQLQHIATAGLDQEFLIRRVTARTIGFGESGERFLYDIEAGSRLLGVEDFLESLIRRGKHVVRSGGEAIDVFTAADDFVNVGEMVDLTLSTEGVGTAKVGEAKVGLSFVG